MPPKAKFTRKEIIEAALKLVRAGGLQAVTARELAAELGCSARPIFTAFKNMEELQYELIEAAQRVYEQYYLEGMKMFPAFKGIGMQYIRFAIEEPMLFKIMLSNVKQKHVEYNDILPIIDYHYDECIKTIQQQFSLTAEQATELYRNLWTYTHGIASMCSEHIYEFEAEKAAAMLGNACRCFLAGLRMQQDTRTDIVPSEMDQKDIPVDFFTKGRKFGE